MLKPCPRCEGREFTGSVLVAFDMVPIQLPTDSEQVRLVDWMEGIASGDKIISVFCSNCGFEQKPQEADL